MMYVIKIARAVSLLPLLLVAAPLAAQHAETPNHVANQAGTVLGTARVCKIDTAQFEGRVEQLLSHMTGGGAALDAANAETAAAANKAEHQERTEPTVGSNNFRRLFTEFWINQSDWTPADGWKPL